MQVLFQLNSGKNAFNFQLSISRKYGIRRLKHVQYGSIGRGIQAKVRKKHKEYYCIKLQSWLRADLYEKSGSVKETATM